MNTSMTKDEREAFLAEVRVGVISIPEERRGPLTVPVWYLYEPGGDVRVWTGSQTRKAALLRASGRASLCVQEPTSPYKYVSIEGPLKIEPVDYERDVRPLAYRYFGEKMGDEYLEMVGGRDGVAADILVRITPERWLTVDYSKLNPPDGSALES